MSKPTPRQKQVIELVKKQCDYWLSTNDIHSPSHFTEIENELIGMELDNAINEEQMYLLTDVVAKVWAAIADLDQRKHMIP